MLNFVPFLRNESNHQICSGPLSPSTAVRSIGTNLLQEHISHQTSPPRSNKRSRNEGKYGEEITSSSRLNELNEHELKHNQKRISRKPIVEDDKTAKSPDDVIKKKASRRNCASSIQNNECITFFEVNRSIMTIQVPFTNQVESVIK